MKNNEIMLRIVERLKTEPGIILLHHNADIDALASALALQSAYPSYSIGAFKNISQMSKKLLYFFNDITILQSPEINKYKTIVILDTSTPNQLGIPQELLTDPIVIDHHTRNNDWKTELYYCDDTKTSCAEIILELLELINFNIPQKNALALLIGILTDSGHFKYANLETFKNFTHLLELKNLTMADVMKIIGNQELSDISQRIAHLKGAQRLKFQQFRKYLVAVSQLNSFEASMCKNLILLGADVAFVGAQRDEEIRISGRATNELVKNGLHLGKFFQSLAEEISCDGGGHAGAAGINGKGDVEMVLNACMKKISLFLNDM